MSYEELAVLHGSYLQHLQNLSHLATLEAKMPQVKSRNILRTTYLMSDVFRLFLPSLISLYQNQRRYTYNQ